MTNEEKVKKSVEIIKKLGLRDRHFNAEEVFQNFREVSVFEIAETFADMVNAINDIKDILKSEDRSRDE